MNRYLEYIYSTWRRLKGPINKYKVGDEQEQKAILVVCRHPLGDTVLETPFIRELRRNYPEHWITVICSPMNKDLFVHCPYVDELIPYDDLVKNNYFRGNYIKSYDFVRKQLTNRKYEIGITPSTCLSSIIDAWIIYLAGCQRRISYSEVTNFSNHHEYMGVYDNYFTDIIPYEGIKHEVLYNLNIISYLGRDIYNDALELWTSIEDKEQACSLFEDEEISQDKLKIIVNLSTSAPSKDWPVYRYIEVAKKLSNEVNVEYLLIGAGATAARYSEMFKEKIPWAHDFTNKTTITQMIEIIRDCDVYIGGDTGPAHIAAAFKLDGLVIYKVAKNIQNDVENFAKRLYPWQSPMKIIQPENTFPGCENGCVKDKPHCILQISTEQVYNVAYSIINKINKRDNM